MTAKSIVDNNSFIDVDIERYDLLIAECIDRNNFGESLQKAREKYPEETALVRAALYRYYSRLSIEDGYLVCSAKKPTDLNMSERTFRAIDNNIKDLNEDAKMERANGNEMNFPPITQSYLDGLLK